MECSICLNDIEKKDLHRTICNHVYHNYCIQIYFNYGKNTCPNCRMTLRRDVVVRDFSFTNDLNFVDDFYFENGNSVILSYMATGFTTIFMLISSYMFMLFTYCYLGILISGIIVIIKEFLISD